MSAHVHRLANADSLFGRKDLTEAAFLRIHQAVVAEEMAEAHRRVHERLIRGEVDEAIIANAIAAEDVRAAS